MKYRILAAASCLLAVAAAHLPSRADPRLRILTSDELNSFLGLGCANEGCTRTMRCSSTGTTCASGTNSGSACQTSSSTCVTDGAGGCWMLQLNSGVGCGGGVTGSNCTQTIQATGCAVILTGMPDKQSGQCVSCPNNGSNCGCLQATCSQTSCNGSG